MSAVTLERDWPFVAAVVVNYNGRRWLDGCLASLFAQDYPAHRLEVWLVDNASDDGSAEHVAECWPRVKLIRAGVNLGFASANNLAIRRARGDWLLLLNNDAVAWPDCLRALVTAGAADVRIGGVAAQLRFLNEPTRLNSTGIKLLRDGRGADRDLNRPVSAAPLAGDVFGGCGAGLLLRREMLDEIHAFDEQLFMYYEDLDLAWRARRRGWKFVYTPDAVALHAGSASAGLESPFQFRCIERNRVLVSIKNAPLFVALASAVLHPLRLGRQLMRLLRRRDWREALRTMMVPFGLLRRLPFALVARWRVASWMRR